MDLNYSFCSVLLANFNAKYAETPAETTLMLTTDNVLAKLSKSETTGEMTPATSHATAILPIISRSNPILVWRQDNRFTCNRCFLVGHFKYISSTLPAFQSYRLWSDNFPLSQSASVRWQPQFR